MPTIKEVSNLYAKKQPKQVEFLTQNTPILSILPFESASHDLWNVYEEVTDIVGGSFVDLDSELPEVSAKTELKKVDLSIMGGIAKVGEDKAKAFGGPANYFRRQEASILRKSGMAAEIAILYNNIRARALQLGNKINAGGSSGKNYSILAVRFVPGDTTGLYSPNGFAGGTLLNVQAVNGGALMEFTVKVNDVTKTILGYKVRYKGYFGFMIASDTTTALLANVDVDSATKKVPTAPMIDELLDKVRADANTFLLMHPRCKSQAINPIKTNALTTNVMDKEINTIVDKWNGVSILTSYNFINGTETDVSFA
jgi:hypothetical protein